VALSYQRSTHISQKRKWDKNVSTEQLGESFILLVSFSLCLALITQPHISGFDWKWEKHFILFKSEKKKMGITPP